MNERYEPHPLCLIFPSMPEDQYQSLKNDIAANGVNEFGTLSHDGRILDGRHRYRACIELGIEMTFGQYEEEVSEEELLKFVLSKNLHRRHLDKSQRAMIAAEIANLKQGRPANEKVSIDTFDVSIDSAAKSMDVGIASVKRAAKVKKSGSPEVVDAVKQGMMSINAAKNLVESVPDKEKQVEIVKQGKDAVRKAVSKAKTKPAKPLPKQSPPPSAIDDAFDYVDADSDGDAVATFRLSRDAQEFRDMWRMLLQGKRNRRIDDTLNLKLIWLSVAQEVQVSFIKDLVDDGDLDDLMHEVKKLNAANRHRWKKENAANSKSLAEGDGNDA